MELIDIHETNTSEPYAPARTLPRGGKICVIGTSCAGKTTLAKELAKYLRLPFVGEVARELPQGSRDSLEIQNWLNTRQRVVERDHGDAVYDSGVVTNLAYITYYSKPNDLKGLESALYALDHIIEDPYRYIIFVDEYFPLEDDGVRDMNDERQNFIYKCLKNLVNTGFFENWSQVITVKGSTEERLATIREAIYF